MIKKSLILILLYISLSNCLYADSITVDGLFDDWTAVPVAHTDIEEEGLDEDFAELKITNDNLSDLAMFIAAIPYTCG